jgi:hypothetical protein
MAMMIANNPRTPQIDGSSAFSLFTAKGTADRWSTRVAPAAPSPAAYNQQRLIERTNINVE